MTFCVTGSHSPIRGMSDKHKQDEPKQETPKDQEIPIPKRGEFLRNLRKVTNTDESGAADRPKQ